jgi:hypothetical protein
LSWASCPRALERRARPCPPAFHVARAGRSGVRTPGRRRYGPGAPRWTPSSPLSCAPSPSRGTPGSPRAEPQRARAHAAKARWPLVGAIHLCLDLVAPFYCLATVESRRFSSPFSVRRRQASPCASHCRTAPSCQTIAARSFLEPPPDLLITVRPPPVLQAGRSRASAVGRGRTGGAPRRQPRRGLFRPGRRPNPAGTGAPRPPGPSPGEGRQEPAGGGELHAGRTTLRTRSSFQGDFCKFPGTRS